MKYIVIVLLCLVTVAVGQALDGIEVLGSGSFGSPSVVSSAPVKYRANLITKGQVLQISELVSAGVSLNVCKLFPPPTAQSKARFYNKL